ncbi:MAG: hypothetical protein Q9180_007713, partial [Flavoplaca navasiana]
MVHVLPDAGKIVIGGGLSTITSTEDELAAVISHAFSHEIADHLSEFTSKLLFSTWTLILPLLLWVPASKVKKGIVRVGIPPISAMVVTTLAAAAASVSWVGLGSFWCREADDIGRLMMMEAGYNPRAIGTVAAKLKPSAVAGTSICRYDAENQEA